MCLAHHLRATQMADATARVSTGIPGGESPSPVLRQRDVLGQIDVMLGLELLHLFDALNVRESDTMITGKTLPEVIPVADFKIGLAICYDLRFPELYRMMGKVDIILAPAAFTAITGKAHWETLVRARAIENQAYLIASAQGGFHVNGRETNGDSMIVDPWGAVLERLPRGAGVVVADIDHAYQTSVRASLPALEHRCLLPC